MLGTLLILKKKNKKINLTSLNLIQLVCQIIFIHTNPQLLWDNVLPNYMYFWTDLGLSPAEVFFYWVPESNMK